LSLASKEGSAITLPEVINNNKIYDFGKILIAF